MTRFLLLMSLSFFFGCGHNNPAPKPEPDGPTKADGLVSLEYGGTHGYHAHSNIDYKAERMADGKTRVTVMVGNDRDRVFEEDGSVMDSLEAIVLAYKMYKYDRQYTPKFDILDGDSWHLYLHFADKNTSCGGYEAYPPGKGAEGLRKIEGFFSRWLNREPAEEVALTAFRYELHDEEGDEVFWFKKGEDRCPVYFRALGSNEGWYYDCGNPDLSVFLGRIMRWYHVASYTGENLAIEETSRPRWIVVAEYANGQKFEVLEYLDRKTGNSDWRHDVPSISGRGIRYDAEHCFQEEFSRIRQLEPGQVGNHSCTTYDGNGKPGRTIHYAGDGTVLGGRDYNNPDMDF